MSTQNLLVELLVEELPPKALPKLGAAFAQTLAASLQAQGLASADATITPYATPRRLAAHITAVAGKAQDKAVQIKLMPVAVGLDKDGNPSGALLKKLQALGLAASAAASLKKQQDGKAEALFLDTVETGATLLVGLQKALDEAIAKLPIPKVMTYQLHTGCELPGWSSVQFVRPAHGLIALHGGAVVPVSALGLQAGKSTRGHRFEAMMDELHIIDADHYAQQLQIEGAVTASFTERKAEIQQQLQAAAAKVGGGCQPLQDEALLDEVTALVERPHVLICEFEKEFLAVPQECLILTMKANQKYFPLLDAAGKLTNRFLVVSNINPADASAVVQGNERVVRPRLADAKFFFDQDRKKTLESRIPALAKVVYHNKLGTQAERSERVAAIAHAIVEQLRLAQTPYSVEAKDEFDVLNNKAQQAARLAKTDLLTDMVGEFPELQGIMGAYYARHEGLRDGVAIAIEDHYKPRFAGDALPRNHTGTVLALADKLETLVGMFGIGNLPTGDKDPFALRRHALGVVRMVVEKALPLDMPALLRQAAASFGALLPDAAVSNAKLLQFMDERMAGYLREAGHAAQSVDAVLALSKEQGASWNTIPARLEAVAAFAQLPEAPALAAANKRIGNILKKAEVEGAVDAHINPALLAEDAEKDLFEALQKILPESGAQFEAGQYTASLQTLAALRAPVDAFFDDVMVNAEATDVRLNRLGLLKTLHIAMNRVADLSRLAA